MEHSKAQTLIARLREEIRRREGAPAAGRAGVPSGFAALDALLPPGGFPAGKVVELCGPRASGKTTLALLAVAAATRAGGLAAFVDPSGELYPPAAQALGADLSRLLVVRVAQGEQAVRAAALLARTQAFAAVVADLPPLSGEPGPLSRRLLEAAEAGQAALVLLSEAPSGLDGSLRIEVARAGVELCLTLSRSRLGPSGRSARGRLPSPEELGAAPAAEPGPRPRLVLLPGAAR
jgi:hypothetical protein